jgi:hypothetical protein
VGMPGLEGIACGVQAWTIPVAVRAPVISRNLRREIRFMVVSLIIISGSIEQGK